MVRPVMHRISLISRLVKGLVVLLALLQLLTFVILANSTSNTEAGSSASFENGLGQSMVEVAFDGAWHDLAVALERNDLSSLWLLGTVEAIPYLFIYYFLYRLFSLYQNGTIFSQPNIRCVKAIGTTLLVWLFVSLFYPITLVLLLRLFNISDQLPFIFIIGSTEISYLISGLVIYVIAWIMQEALTLKSEQELVI